MKTTFQLGLEDELILCCARTHMDEDIEKRMLFLVKSDLDWDYLLYLININNLNPLLFWHLNRVCSEFLPQKLLRIFKDYSRETSKKNLLMFRELMNVLEYLKSNDIPAVSYKGPFLAISAYGNLSLRNFSDLDIFVPKEYINKVEILMLSLEYKPLLDLTNNQKELFLKFQREFKFLNDLGVAIEIKWRFPVSTFSFPVDPLTLFDIENFSLNDLKFEKLSAERLLLVLCLHNAGHYWQKLSLICDIAEHIRSNDINWILTLKIAEKLSIKRILFINLLLAKNLLDLTLPDEVSSNLNNEYLNSIYLQIAKRFFSKEKKELTLTQKVMIRIRIRESFKYKILDFINLIIIPTPGVLESVSLPIFLSPIYNILRIIQLFNNYILGSLKKFIPSFL